MARIGPQRHRRKTALIGCIARNESSVHGLESFKIQINMFRFLSIEPFLSFIAK